MGRSHSLLSMIQERLPWGIVEESSSRGEMTLVVAREAILEALSIAKEAGGPWMLTDLTAVDRFPAEPRFEVVYHLTCLFPPDRLRLKVQVPGLDPVVPSVAVIWPSANWAEREVYDLYGIRFSGHPDLRRILLPDDWEGHPLRKDYPLSDEPVEFRGVEPKPPAKIVPKGKAEGISANPFGSFDGRDEGAR
ncbi:MAG: NADH-quinone oxidoreductase subunit C [Armatimonadota bacterium]|nr:NADH-quinone oxidoreductase subunit C [Armatimonadota bacterium]MDR7433570.1 NADH-quinone oxidoreductase subunit C [Armatimonadota bacterium]